eukprot:684720-Prymnesium_polylepis.1
MTVREEDHGHCDAARRVDKQTRHLHPWGATPRVAQRGGSGEDQCAEGRMEEGVLLAPKWDLGKVIRGPE